MASTETITYSFVQFYYQKLHEDPTKLYQIYTPNAKLTHSKIPTDVDQSNISNKSLETIVFGNKNDIEKFYSSANYFADSKIRVSSIDSQSVFEDSILINVIGELALTDESPVYRFTQSFILTPGNVANSYDITNDIFKLIPDDDFELNNIEQEIEQEEIKEIKKEQEDEEISKPIETIEQVVNGKVEESIQTNGKIEDKSTIVEEIKEIEQVKQEESKEELKEEVIEQAEEEEAKIEQEKPIVEREVKKEEKSKPSAPIVPSAPLTWAGHASQTPKVKPTKPKEKPTTKQSTTSSTTTTTSTPAASTSSSTTPAATTTTSTSAPAQSTSPPSTQASTASPTSPSQTSNRKKSHLFPVQVNNINLLKSNELKIALEKAFGKTTKVEPRGHFGLVDFETKESQQKALNIGELKIGTSRVTFEVKARNIEFNDKGRKNNNNNNNNSTTANNRQNNKQNNTNNKQTNGNGSMNPKKKTNAK